MIYKQHLPKPGKKDQQPRFNTMQKVLDYFEGNDDITFYPCPDKLSEILGNYHGQHIFLVRLDEMEDRKDFQGDIPGWAILGEDGVYSGPGGQDVLFELNVEDGGILVWVIDSFDHFLYSLDTYLKSHLPLSTIAFATTRVIINTLLNQCELNDDWFAKGFGEDKGEDPVELAIASMYKEIFEFQK